MNPPLMTEGRLWFSNSPSTQKYHFISFWFEISREVDSDSKKMSGIFPCPHGWLFVSDVNSSFQFCLWQLSLRSCNITYIPTNLHCCEGLLHYFIYFKRFRWLNNIWYFSTNFFCLNLLVIIYFIWINIHSPS